MTRGSPSCCSGSGTGDSAEARSHDALYDKVFTTLSGLYNKRHRLAELDNFTVDGGDPRLVNDAGKVRGLGLSESARRALHS